jgi:hypothetical protein
MDNSSRSFFHYVGAVHHHGSEDAIRELESVLSDFLRSSKHHKTLMGNLDVDQHGSSEESLRNEKSQHLTYATAPTDTESSCITPTHWTDHRGFSSNGIDTDQNIASTRGVQEGSRTTTMSLNITEQDGRYTDALKQKSDQESLTPSYSKATQKENPPLWMVTVTYNNVTEAGQAKTKKEAKHLASKKAWFTLGGTEI